MSDKGFWSSLRRWSKPKENVWPTASPELDEESVKKSDARHWIINM